MRHTDPTMERYIRDLTEIRLAQGLSLRDLAAKIGTSKSAVHFWETGQRYPTTGLFFQWASALGYEVILVPKSQAERLFNPESLSIRI